MTPIRVLHVITRLCLGGSSENTVAQVLALRQAGYDCRLVVGEGESDPGTVEDARRRGCPLVPLPGLGREVSASRDLTALVTLTRLLRRERPMIVHTHTSKAGFIGRLAARLAGVPVVVHQPHGHIFYGYYGAVRSGLFVRVERLAARWTRRIVTLTERGTEEHLALRIGRREQFVAIPSGVPAEALRVRAPARDAARAHLGLAPDDFVIVGVGRLVYVKGFDLLVAALPRVLGELPAARLVLVGDGPDRASLEAQAIGFGVAGRLVLAGAVAGAAGGLLYYLAAADVCAAPSRNEGMGRALVEAMALGLPVVGAAVGGVPDVVGPDEAGRLVPAEDPQALADALIELGQDARLRQKLGEAARARAERFTTEAADARLLELYATLVREHGAP
ncbi:MAG: glycosyltransferase [Candidatus Rokuibacteriota bacterium]